MKTPPIFTTKGPYIVMAEDLWDYYKEPPIRRELFRTENYLEALIFAYSWYDKCVPQDLHYPWKTSLWISPEPPGLHFDYNTYTNYLTEEKS